MSNIWVAVGSGGNTIATSTDAVTWTGRGKSVFTSIAYWVAYGNGLFVAVGQGGNTIATSTDGITWTGRGSSVFTSYGYGVKYANGLWVAVGYGENSIATSTDGITWTGRGTSGFLYGSSVAYGNGLWVAVGGGGNTIASSPDGITWTGRTNTIINSVAYGVAYANGLWVVGGRGGNSIATSTDGINWTGRGSTIFSTFLYGIGYENGLWVGTGQGGNIFGTSTDGITWTGRGSAGITTQGMGLAYANNLWVATGVGGNCIATSPNGITWTGRTGTTIFSNGHNVVGPVPIQTVLTNFSIPAKAFGNAAFTITPPTSNSTGAFTYTSSNTAVATIAGSTITIIGVGTSTITATQASITGYTSATITATLTVSKATTVITNFTILPRAVGSAAFVMTAPTTNSNGALTYTSSNPDVATISGSTITIVGMGGSTITVTQASTDNYELGTATTTFYAFVSGTYTENNLNYTYYNGMGTATVTGGTTAARALSSLTVLESFVVGGITYTVTGVGDNAFNGWPNLTNISLPPSIRTIGIASFASSKLASFTFPPLVTILEQHVFNYCTSLTSITIPPTLTTFNYVFNGRHGGSSTGAFFGCSGLVNIVINTYIPNCQYIFFRVNNPNMSVTFDYPGVVPPNCFESQSNLKTVIIGNQITSVTNSFVNCANLTNVTLGSSLTAVGGFGLCPSLRSITIPTSVTTITSYAFANCTNLNNVIIPPSVTTIAEAAFESCTSLTSITLPSSVTSAGYRLFAGCTNLASIVIKSYIGLSSVFNGLNSLNISLTFDYAGFVPAYTSSNIALSVKSVILSNLITGIESYAFSGCTGLTEITIPASITAIQNNAFFNCTNLNSVSFFGNIPTIGSNNFTASSTDTAFYKVDGTTNTNATTVAAALSMFANKTIIGSASPTITNFSISMKKYNDVSFSIVDPSSNSGGAFSYESSNPDVATVSGRIITIVASGSTTITATQATNYKNGVNYTSGTITTTFVVDNPPPQVGPLIISNKSLSDVSFLLVDPTKPDNSTGTWTYASSDLTKATISGNEVTLLESGIVKITATISSDSNYCSTTVTKLFSISAVDVVPSTFVFVSSADVSNAIPVTVQPVANAVVFSPEIFTPEKVELFNPSAGTPEEKVENRNSLVNTFFEKYSTANTISIPATAFYMPPTFDSANITEVKLLKTTGSTSQTPFVINASTLNMATGFFCPIDEVGNSVLFNGINTFANYSVRITKVSDNNYTVIQTKQGVPTTISAVKDDIIYYAGFKLVIGSIAGQLSTLQLVTLSNFSVPVKTLEDTTFTLVPPTTTSNGAFTYTSSNTEVATVAGNIVTVVGLGTSTITAVQARTNTYLSDTITALFTVNKITPIITNFSIPTKTVEDAPFSLVPPTSSSDDINGFTYTSSNTAVATVAEGIVTIVGGGTATITAVQGSTARYTSGTTTTTLTVNKLATVLTNFSVPEKTFGNAAFTLVAPTSNRTGTFSYISSNTAVATIAGNVVTIVGGGTSTITAVQASTSIYEVQTITATLTVNQLAAVLSNFSVPTKTYGNASFNLVNPTSNSNGAFTYTSSDTTVATIVGSAVTIVGGGSTTITAVQASTNNYTSGTITANFTVNKLTTTLSNFTVPANLLINDTFTANTPSSNRAGTFTYTSSNTSVATVVGNIVIVVGGGTSIITATQGSTSIYESKSIAATLTINQITTVLSNFIVPAKKVGDTFTITPPTTNGDGAFTYTSSNTAVATVTNNTITTVGVGSSTITATQAGTPNSTTGSITATLQVTQGTLILSNFSVPVKTILDEAFSITPPTTNSIGLITYTSSNASVATIVGNLITIVGVGTATITASQASTVNYTSATITDIFHVIKATPTLSNFSIPNKTLGNSAFVITPPTSTSNGAFTYASSNTAVATILGNRIVIKGVGTTTITATQATTSIYTSETITAPFQVDFVTTVLSNFTMPAKTFGNIPFKVQASSNSSGAINYTSSDLSVATIVGDIVTIVGAGSSTITATQEAWNNFASATITDTLQVSPITTVLTAFSLPVKTLGNTDFTIIPPSSNREGTFTYTSSNEQVATITGNMVTLIGAGTSTITAVQASTSNYTSETISATLQVNQGLAVLTNFAVPTKVFGDAAFNLVNPSSNSDGAFTYSSSNALVASIAGNVVTIVGAGNVTITATQASTSNYISGTITAPFIVTKNTPTITNLSVPNKSFGDAPFTIIPPTTNGVGVFSYTSSNTEVATIVRDVITIVGIGTSTITAVQATSANYTSGTISTTFTVNQASAVLTNFSIPTKTIGDTAFTITPPTTNSNGALTYASSDLSVATVEGSTITIVGSGTSTINASQASTPNYASGTTNALLTVNRMPTLLTDFTVPVKTFGDVSFVLAPPTSSREGTFTYESSNHAVATIEGDVVTIVGGGNATISAVQPSTATYRSATISALLQVNQLKTVITEFSVPAKIIGEEAFTLVPPTTNSNGTFTYTSSNPAVATIEGDVVTIVGLGDTTIKAVQASTANYTTDAMNALFQVKLIRTVLSNFAVPAKTVGDTAFTITPPTTNSDGVFTYSSSNLLVATVAENAVTIVGTGNVTITAFQASTQNSTPAKITASLTVNKATNSISWFSVPEKIFGNAPFELTPPTTNSNGAFTYTSSNLEVATISRNIVTIVGIGTSTITAVQANTVNYTGGTITATFTVSEGTPSLTNFSVPVKTAGDVAFSLVPPTSKSNGAFTYTSSNHEVATIDGDVVTIVGVGTSTISAIQASTASFISGTITTTLQVNQITTVLTNFSIPVKTFGDTTFSLVPPTSDNNGAFTYTSSNDEVATIDGDVVTIVGGGNVTITAVQASTARYTSATITGLLQVNKAKTTLTNFSVPTKNFGETAFSLVPPVSNSNGTFTYTSSNPEVGTIEGDVVTIVGLGDTTIKAVQASTANYTSDSMNALFKVNLISSVLTNFMVPSKIIGDTAFTLVPPTTNTNGAFTYSSSNLLVATVAQDVVTIVGVGTANITAVQASTANSTSATITTPLVVNKKTAILTDFSVPAKTFGNESFTITPPTSNSNGAFTYTSSDTTVATISKNVVTIVGIGTTTITAVQTSTANFTSGTITALFQVNQGIPVLTNFSVGSKTFGNDAFSITPPTTNSDGAFTYISSDPAVATIDGNMVTIVGAGTSTITASQASTTNYLSGTITASLTVNPITTVLTNFSAISKALGNPSFNITPPTSNSNGAFTYTSSNLSVVTIDGDVATIVGGGTSTITVVQASTNNYTTATTTASFQVSALTTVLSDFNLPTKAVGNEPFAITPPTTNGDGVFSYTSSNTGIATIAGNMITIVGAGTSTISAIQSSTGNYSSATITALLIVNKGTPIIPSFTLPIKEIGMGDFTIIDPSSTSMGAFTYTSSNVKVATIFKNIVSIKGIGDSTITATQAMTNNYIPATISTTFTVNQMSPTITNYIIPATRTVGDATFKIANPKSKSTSPFTFTSSNNDVATVTKKNVVTIVGAGTTVIAATQPGTKSWGPGTVTATLQVNQRIAFLTNFSISKRIIGIAPFTITPPTTNSNGAFTYTSTNTNVATIDGNLITIVGVGTSTIIADQASNSNYTSGTISTPLLVNLPTPQVGVFDIPNKSLTNPTFTIENPTKPIDNTGTWTYTSSDLAKATISGNEVTLLEPGIVTITASLSGDSLYNSTILMTQFSISEQGVAPSSFVFAKSSEVVSAIPPTVLPLLNTILPLTVSIPANAAKFNPVLGTIIEKQANQYMVVNTLCNMFSTSLTVSVPTPLLYVPLTFNKSKFKTIKLVRPNETTVETPLIINTIKTDSAIVFLCSIVEVGNSVQFNGNGSFLGSFIRISRGADNKYMVTRTDKKNISISGISLRGDIITFAGITAMIGYN